MEDQTLLLATFVETIKEVGPTLYFVADQTLLLATYMETIKEVGPTLYFVADQTVVQPCCWLHIWKLLEKWAQHYFVEDQTLLLATFVETIKEVGQTLYFVADQTVVQPCCWLHIWKLLEKWAQHYFVEDLTLLLVTYMETIKKWAQHYFVEDQTLLLATIMETIKEVGPTLLCGRPDPAVGYLYGNY